MDGKYYYRYHAIIEEGFPETYVELDDDYFTLRLIIVLQDKLIGSNKSYFENPYTSEVNVTIGEEPENPNELLQEYKHTVVQISHEEFILKCNQYIKSHYDEGKEIKTRFQIDDQLIGILSINFPIEVYVEIEKDLYGLIPNYLIPNLVTFNLGVLFPLPSPPWFMRVMILSPLAIITY